MGYSSYRKHNSRLTCQASKWFNVKEYLRVNPDLSAAYGDNYQAALMHYALWGVDEKRALGNVEPPPSTGGTPYLNLMSGIWISPELPGRHVEITQNGYFLTACNADYPCSPTGVSGRMDAKHNVVLSGLATIYGPRVQYTAKFNTPSHGTLIVDYCEAIYQGFACNKELYAGARLSAFKQ